MFASILTFDFDLILGSFLTFWSPNGLFLGFGLCPKAVLGCTHLVVQLSFCMFPSILVLVFTEFWGHVLLLGVLMGYFWG